MPPESEGVKGTAKKGSCDILSKNRTMLMGIAILMILLFHFTEDCKVYGRHYSGFIEWYKTYVGSSSVDMFLFLSGLGLYYSMKKNPSVPRFYRRRFFRVLVPYLLVAVLSWYLYDVVWNGESIARMLQDLTFVTFFTEGVRWFWYIGAILACYLVYPAVFVLVDKCRNGILRLGILLLLCVLVTLYAVQMRENDPELFRDINIVLLRIPPFLIGCFYGRESYEKRRGYWLWVPAAVVSIFLLAAVPDSESVIYIRYVLAAANISVCACAAALLGKLRSESPVVRVLEWFGARSLELYLTHVAVRRMMCEFDYLTCEVDCELVMFTLSVALAALLHKLTDCKGSGDCIRGKSML